MARVKVEKNIAFDDVRNLYYVTFNYGYEDKPDKNGKKKQIKTTKTFTDKKEAQKVLREFETNKDKNNIVMPNSATLEEWLNYWIDDIKSINCEKTTIYGYRNIINNHLIPVIGHHKLQQLNGEIINKYFSNRKKFGLSNNTLRKHYDLLKYALNSAVDEEKILKNPMKKILPIKKERNEMNFYSIEQLQQLFDVVENDRMEVVVKLSGMLGLRREEISALKWKNVDLDNKTITIAEARTQAGKSTIEKHTKNLSSHRTLSAPDEIVEIFEKIKQTQETQKKLLKNEYNDKGFIMAWDDGRPYRPNYLSDLFKEIIDNNNLPKLRLHDLRHTFASIANELGVSLFDISKALGHSQIGTTSQIYTHQFDKTNKKAINKVAEGLSKKKKENKNQDNN